MEKYKIKKAGIGMKTFTSDLRGRVFEDNVFGLCYIISEAYFKENALGYPALVISSMSCNMLHPFLVYVPDGAETWAGEITTDKGEKVSCVKTEIYI